MELNPQHLLIFAMAALLMVLSPGPNMLYLVSRTLCQGRVAGLISLAGVITGFICHMLAAAFGLSGLFLAQPLAYELLKYAGALYLLWLAWQSIKPGGRSPFEARQLSVARPVKLFSMGLVTNLLNPKIIVFYLSILPQFITDPTHVLGQSLALGSLQIGISFVVNLLITLCAASIAAWLGDNPGWLRVQRYVMGTVLAGLAARMAAQK